MSASKKRREKGGTDNALSGVVYMGPSVYTDDNIIVHGAVYKSGYTKDFFRSLKLTDKEECVVRTLFVGYCEVPLFCESMRLRTGIRYKRYMKAMKIFLKKGVIK